MKGNSLAEKKVERSVELKVAQLAAKLADSWA